MTADFFSMEPYYRSLSCGLNDVWRIEVEDCDMRTEFRVMDEDVQKVLGDNFEYITETVKKKLFERVDILWDDDKVTDEEKKVFTKILEAVIG